MTNFYGYEGLLLRKFRFLEKYLFFDRFFCLKSKFLPQKSKWFKNKFLPKNFFLRKIEIFVKFGEKTVKVRVARVFSKFFNRKYQLNFRFQYLN